MRFEIAPITKKMPRKPENIKKLEGEIVAELDKLFSVIDGQLRLSDEASEQTKYHFCLGGIGGVFFFALGYDRKCSPLIYKQVPKWFKKRGFKVK